MNKKNILTLSILAGIFAPIIFVAVFTVEGAIRPGYDPMSMYISALSIGSRGWIQIINFLIFGLLLFVSTYDLSRENAVGKELRSGVLAFRILAFLIILAGIFVMDPADTSSGQYTLTGLIHGLSGGLIFLIMPFIIFIYLRRIWIEKEWDNIRNWTLILFLIEAVGVNIFIYVSKIPHEEKMYLDWLGLFQRIAVIPFMFWLFLFNYVRLQKCN